MSSVLDILFSRSLIDAIAAILRPSLIDSEAQELEHMAQNVTEKTVIVFARPRFTRALASRGYPVASPGDAVRVPMPQRPEFLPDHAALAGTTAAIIAVGVGQRDDWHELITTWRQAVDSEGPVVFVDRGVPAVEMSRRALCGGLSGLEQRRIGGQILTSATAPKSFAYAPSAAVLQPSSILR